MKRAPKKSRKTIAPYAKTPTNAKEIVADFDSVDLAEVGRILLAIDTLDTHEPFALAALLDWIRNEWRGDPAKLGFDGDRGTRIIEALKWIRERSKILRRKALDHAGTSAIRAAVMS